MNPELQRLSTKFKRAINIAPTVGRLGTGTDGQVRDSDHPGNYWVRFANGAGEYSAPISIPLAVNANLPDTDNLAVEVGWRKERMIILGAQIEGLDAAGVNREQLNPLNDINDFVNQEQLTPLRAMPHPDTANKPFTAVVFPGWISVGGVPTIFPGGEIDISSLQPAAGEHVRVCVFVKSDMTLEAFAGTAIDNTDPLPPDEIQTIAASATAGSIPAWAWDLGGNDTVLSMDKSRQVDLRQPFNIGSVTNVAMTVPSGFSVGGSPVISSGTLGITLDSQAANKFLASPSGGAGVPTFRVISASDIPSLAGSYANLALSNLSGATSDMLPQYLLHQPTADWSIDASASTMGAIGGAAVATQKLTIYTGADANKGIQIRQNSATQSGNLFEIANSSGTLLSAIGPANTWALGLSINATTRLRVGTGADGNIGLMIRAFSATQSANLFQLENSSGGILAAFGSTGALSIGTTPVAGTPIRVINTYTDAGPDTMISFSMGLNSSADNTNTNIAVIVQPQIVSTNSHAVTTLTSEQYTVTHNGSGTLTNGNGIVGRVDNAAAGIITIATAANFNVRNLSTGTIGTGYGINVSAGTNSGGGTFTTAYGIFINNISGAGTNSAITTNAGNIVFNEGGDVTTVIRFEGDTDQNLFCTVPGTDRIGFGTASANTKGHFLLTDSGTNAIVNVLTAGHDSSGTPAVGFGTGFIFEAKSSTTTSQSMGRLTYEWATATHATRKALSKWSVFDTAEREGIRIEASGTVPQIGFYGHASAAQASAYTPTNVSADRSYDANSTTVDEIADVLGTLIADLQAVGLVG